MKSTSLTFVSSSLTFIIFLLCLIQNTNVQIYALSKSIQSTTAVNEILSWDFFPYLIEQAAVTNDGSKLYVSLIINEVASWIAAYSTVNRSVLYNLTYATFTLDAYNDYMYLIYSDHLDKYDSTGTKIAQIKVPNIGAFPLVSVDYKHLYWVARSAVEQLYVTYLLDVNTGNITSSFKLYDDIYGYYTPSDIAIGNDGNIYFADFDISRIHIHNSQGKSLPFELKASLSSNRINSIAVDNKNIIWIGLSITNHEIYKFSQTGTVDAQYNPTMPYLRDVTCITVDGNLTGYAVDGTNYRIVIIKP